MKLITILLAALACSSLEATILVPGDGTPPFSFTVPVTAKAFDRATGSFYVGLASPATATNTIMMALRRAADAPSKFVGILTTATTSQTIEFMTLSTCESYLTCLSCPELCQGPPSPCTIPCNVPEVPTPCAERTNLQANLIFSYLVAGPLPAPFTQTIINALNATPRDGKATGTIVTASQPLLDASGALNANGQQTTGIVALAANKDFAFAAVRPTGGTANFGDPGSGVASVSIEPTTLTLIQVPAKPGDTGIKASPLDATSPSIMINNPVVMGPPAIPIPNLVDMIWDDPLHLLYLGIQLATSNVGVSGGRSVVVGQVGPCGTINFIPIAPDSAFAVGNFANIVGVLGNNISPSLSAQFIRILHASTGPSYLIVNGGNGTAEQTNNMVFALPLVDQPLINNAINPAHGTLADKNAPLVDFKFVVPATANAQLPVDNEPAVVVGAGTLPILPTTPIADMVVSGDTVYVSINANPDAQNDAGIFYSQALFDQDGKILRWTPWTKRAFPVTAFMNTTSQCHRTSFFDVDLVNDVVWAVDGETNRIVEQTAWEAQINDCSLVGRLNAVLSCGGATSVLDLDQATRGFTGNNTTPYRYALFGGNGTVVFAIISISKSLNPNGPSNPTLQDPQMVTTNFLAPGYFLCTQLPDDQHVDCVTPQHPCSVNTLEYARQLPGTNTNYFFAGTNNGLYVLADNFGNGFDVRTFALLNEDPFVMKAWYKAPNIPGNIIRVRTTGNTLYVLAYQTTPINPMLSTLYRINFKDSVDAMFDPSNIITIAQSHTGSLAQTLIFNDFQIISTNLTGSTEQVVLATNRGLYKSSRPGGVQAATDQINAAWAFISPGFAFYNGIGAPDTNIPIDPPSTLWPFATVQQLDCCAPSDLRGTLEQLAGTTDAGPYNRVPPFFISNDCCNHNFDTIPALTYFWSDGARRIGITATCPSELLSFPYNTLVWNVDNPDDALLFDYVLEQYSIFYWIKQIGVSGMLLVGTEKGVVGLQ